MNATGKKSIEKALFQERPKFLKTEPYYLVKIPWVSHRTSDDDHRFQYNNELHAALHSILAALIVKKDKDDILFWIYSARIHLSRANRCLLKPGASMIPDRRKMK